MGDVQGRCQEDSDGEVEFPEPVDPRDLIGPPDRVAMDRSVHITFQIPQFPPSELEDTVSSRSRMSDAGSDCANSTVQENKLTDCHRRQSVSTDVSPLNPRPVLGPPNRAEMARRLQTSYQVPLALIPVCMGADSNVSSKRRMSNADAISTDLAVLEKKARDGVLIQSQSTNVTPSDKRNRKMSFDDIRRQSVSTDVTPSDKRNRKLSLAGSFSPDLSVLGQIARDAVLKQLQSTYVTPSDSRNRKISFDGVRRQSEPTNVTPSDKRNRKTSLAGSVSLDLVVLGKRDRDGGRRQSESTEVTPSDLRNRKMSLAGSVSPDLAVNEKKARDSHCRQSESTDVTPSDKRNRKMSLAGSVSPDLAVHEKKARDGHCRQSESKDVTPSDKRHRKTSLDGSVSPGLVVHKKKARDGHRRQSESTDLTPSDPPDQAAMSRHQQPNSQVQQYSTPEVMSAESCEVQNRSVSFPGTISQDPTALGKETRDIRRRESESTGATNPTINAPALSKSRRMNTVTLPPDFQDLVGSGKHSTVFPPSYIDREPLGEVSNSLPLFDAITRGNPSEKEMLVSEGLETLSKEQVDPQLTPGDA